MFRLQRLQLSVTFKLRLRGAVTARHVVVLQPLEALQVDNPHGLQPLPQRVDWGRAVVELDGLDVAQLQAGEVSEQVVLGDLHPATPGRYDCQHQHTQLTSDKRARRTCPAHLTCQARI